MTIVPQERHPGRWGYRAFDDDGNQRQHHPPVFASREEAVAAALERWPGASVVEGGEYE